jgi:hypothetical protein
LKKDPGTRIRARTRISDGETSKKCFFPLTKNWHPLWLWVNVIIAVFGHFALFMKINLKVIFYAKICALQGCQIFLGTTYQSGKNVSK